VRVQNELERMKRRLPAMKASQKKFDGYIFDSKKEYTRYMELKLLETSGHIKDLQVKTRFEVLPKNDRFRAIYYECDFDYRENGVRKIEDVKGYRAGAAYAIFKLKQKMMYHRYSIVVMEV